MAQLDTTSPRPGRSPELAASGPVLSGSGSAECGPAGVAAASVDELGGQEIAPEQLDWGSIDDEDGEFGQISAAAATIEDAKLISPGSQVDRKGKDCAFTPLDLAGLENPASAREGGACSGAIAQGGMSNGGGPACSGVRLEGEASSKNADGDASTAAITSAAASSTPAGASVAADGDGTGAAAITAAVAGGATPHTMRPSGEQQVNQSRPHARVLASKLYRPEASNKPIRASMAIMTYCDAAHTPPRPAAARPYACQIWKVGGFETLNGRMLLPFFVLGLQWPSSYLGKARAADRL